MQAQSRSKARKQQVFFRGFNVEIRVSNFIITIHVFSSINVFCFHHMLFV
jgi:hypothetical protein